VGGRVGGTRGGWRFAWLRSRTPRLHGQWARKRSSPGCGCGVALGPVGLGLCWQGECCWTALKKTFVHSCHVSRPLVVTSVASAGSCAPRSASPVRSGRVLIRRAPAPQVNHEDAGGAGEPLAHGDQVELFESAWPASPRAPAAPLSVCASSVGGDLERQRRLLQRAFTASGELPPEPASPVGRRAERVPA